MPATHGNLPDLYQKLAQVYNFAYVSGRPFGNVETIRDFIKHHNFPPGPIFAAPYEFLDSVTTFARQTTINLEKTFMNELKMAGCQVHAGFGNRWKDYKAFIGAGIPPQVSRKIYSFLNP